MIGDDGLIDDAPDGDLLDVDTDSDDGDKKPHAAGKRSVGVIPDHLPVLPLRDSVVFPGTIMPLKVVRKHLQRVLEAAFDGPRMICAVAQRRSDVEDPKLSDVYRVGTACAILRLNRPDEDNETIILQGIARVGIVEVIQETPFLVAQIQPRPDDVEPSTELEALAHSVRSSAHRAIELSPHVPEEALEAVDSIPTVSGLADFLAANLALPLVNKQELLETFDVKDRLAKINEAVVRQIQVLEISQKIQNQVRRQVDRTQREYYLREELKAIQRELGVADARSADVERYRERLAKANPPKQAEEEAFRELERLENIPQSSPEYANIIDYLEWICALPWSVSTDDDIDINKATKILDADHFGLQKIKKRIIEFLAVLKLKPDGKGPILCFVGPPGVGKTSLGQSIARALGRKFARISLGGVHDEADIRGHRRTYIGAMPGRLIQELRKVGSNNPVFMLDEVDKIGQDFRGDPASALLEVLDPAQNSTFSDHYLDVHFDLSRVLFIATANYLDAIPGPLYDRMEVIELSGYTRREKVQIAKRYLVPRQLEENGLEKGSLTFDAESLATIISNYTVEAGVRGLERKIGAICRAKAADIVRGSTRKTHVTIRNLSKYLGNPIYEANVASEEAVPGVVTGLAYTPYGGEILFVEAAYYPGNGGFKLTGQLGDVMRESAQAAVSVVKGRSASLKIDRDFWFENDFHIHVPAGATPKDGPSAGVAMFAALTSLLTGIIVDPHTGMTGEITLRGKVLPVGGVREKMLAAHRAGLRRILLPYKNMRDLDELPADIRKEMEFVPIKSIDKVVATLFKPVGASSKRTTKKTGAKKSASKPSPKSKSKRPKAKTSTRKPAARKKRSARKPAAKR